MKFLTLIFAVLFTSLGTADAQKYFTRNGKISFHSDAPLEKIEAVNSSATSVLDTESGKMEFAVLIKGFQFEKALMQEHFNENYMESSKYPKAVFKGQIDNLDDVKFSTPGTYPVKISGDLTIHGVTQSREMEGTLSVKDSGIVGTSIFEVTVADHNIKIPAVVKDNIAKVVEVNVEMNYQPFNK